MKIDLHIETEDPAEIQKVFAALAGVETKVVTGGIVPVATVKPAIPAEVKEVVESSTTEKTEVATPTEPEETPAQRQKREISEKIVALGGTPPERGSVAKFQEALDALTTDMPDGGEPPEGDVEESDVDDISTDDAGEDTESDEISIDAVRTLAHALVKSTPDNPTLGKQKLGACLKKVGAANLTGATQEQLKAIVPLLEENAGVTLAEVVAEAN